MPHVYTSYIPIGMLISLCLYGIYAIKRLIKNVCFPGMVKYLLKKILNHLNIWIGCCSVVSLWPLNIKTPKKWINFGNAF